MERDTIFTIKTCFFQALKCSMYYYHPMNWSLYSSRIRAVTLDVHFYTVYMLDLLYSGK